MLQALGGPGPGPAAAVREGLQVGVGRLPGKGVPPQLPGPCAAPPQCATAEQQQVYVGRVIEYVFRIAESGSRRQNSGYSLIISILQQASSLRYLRGLLLLLRVPTPTACESITPTNVRLAFLRIHPLRLRA